MTETPEESQEDMLERVHAVASADMAICKVLLSACLGMQDDDTAEALLRRVREHVALGSDEEKMYGADYYLEYLTDLIELVQGFEHIKPLSAIAVEVIDNYEAFRKNKYGLYGALNRLHGEYIRVLRSKNYWKN